ncbi:MAG: AraC family transcriptional regulator [Acidovorax sp.]
MIQPARKLIASDIGPSSNPPGPRQAGIAQLAALHEKRFSPVKLAVLIEVAAQAGLEAAAVLEGVGLDARAIADPFVLTSSLQFLTASRNLVRLHGSPALGVEIGRRLGASSYGMYGYAMLCAETCEQACDLGVKHHALANNGLFSLHYTVQDGMVTWLLPTYEYIALPDVDEALYQFLLEKQFALHVRITKDVMGSWCVPARATFAYPQPPHGAAIADALECPLAFGQPRNTLCYPAAWLKRPPQLANPMTAAQVSAQCARMLEEFDWQVGITRRVFQELTRAPGRFPDTVQIAERLGMTARTLGRKLAAESTSYSKLLTSVRKALAIDYLTTTRMSVNDIALALGFSDAVGFNHAFKRWTGKSPNQFRGDGPS